MVDRANEFLRQEITENCSVEESLMAIEELFHQET
jgi:hypothetical protein